MKSTWVVEYSIEQESFNIDTLENILKKNLEMCINKISNDYKIIFIAHSYEECSDFINKYRREIEEYV